MPNYLKLILMKMLAIVACVAVADAQSLPSKQKISVWAPADVKIDGVINDWSNKFMAYNHVVDVYYTIANDDNNLYLIIQASRSEIIQKIIKGGVTFTINHTGKKTDKDGIAITFPMYEKKETPLFLVLNNKPAKTPDLVKNKFEADSFLNAKNKQLIDKFRSIGIMNGKEKIDTIFSIYNIEGIKAQCLLDDQLNYNSELAIPLKYLDMSTNKSVKLNYNIKLNGTTKGSEQINTISTPRGDMISYVGSDGKKYLIGSATPENMILAYPTDFWGEYTLAKKP